MKCHSWYGPGGASIPGACGGHYVVKKPTDYACSVLYSVNAGDVKMSATYLVVIIY